MPIALQSVPIKKCTLARALLDIQIRMGLHIGTKNFFIRTLHIFAKKRLCSLYIKGYGSANNPQFHYLLCKLFAQSAQMKIKVTQKTNQELAVVWSPSPVPHHPM